VRAIKPGAYEYEAAGGARGCVDAPRLGTAGLIRRSSGRASTARSYTTTRTVSASKPASLSLSTRRLGTATTRRTSRARFPASGKFNALDSATSISSCSTRSAQQRKLSCSANQAWPIFQRVARGVMEVEPPARQAGQTRSIKYFYSRAGSLDRHGRPRWLGATECCRLDRCFTIEPGIYLPDEGFGVRIEDDYLVYRERSGEDEREAAIGTGRDRANDVARARNPHRSARLSRKPSYTESSTWFRARGLQARVAVDRVAKSRANTQT